MIEKNISPEQINPGAVNSSRGFKDIDNNFNNDPLLDIIKNDNDPWKHRSAEMKCRTCMYYVRKKTSTEVDGSIEIGRCRRSAPTMKGYPVVFPYDWCGEHKLDEEKLLCG